VSGTTSALYDGEAEGALLASVLLDSAALDDLGPLAPADFVLADHRAIWCALREVHDAGLPIELVSVRASLRAAAAADSAHELLAALIAEVPQSAAPRYAEIVRLCSQRRQLQALLASLRQRVGEPGSDVEQLVAEADAGLHAIVGPTARGAGLRSSSDVLVEVFRAVEARHEQPADVTGLATGLRDIDRLTSGLQPGDLVILAGRPGSGKTTAAAGWALHVAQHAAPVAFFSLEMASTRIVLRMLSAESGVEHVRMRRGTLTDADWPRLAPAADRIHRARLYLDDTSALSLSVIRTRARHLLRTQGLSLVVVDYLQLLDSPRGTGRESREQQVSALSRGLKRLAGELAVPVVALSQLNRAVESRTNRRPVLADLRDSGALEQDADLVVFAYRAELHDQATRDRGIVELIVAKQRDGETGAIRCAFDGARSRISDLEEKREDNAGAKKKDWHDDRD